MTYIVQQRTKAEGGVEVWLDIREDRTAGAAQDFARVLREGAMNRSDVRVVQRIGERDHG